ncbi:MAG: PQQ-dependent sugar dehydrogenase [Ignavibacteria bacterium]|nr:PQQ-dependent sugar dehydrogenase [Ignavibacteria bacterium]
MIKYFSHSLALSLSILKYFILIFIVATNSSLSQFEIQNAFPNLTFNNPLFLTNSNDGTNKIFVVEQSGRIKVFPNNSNALSAKEFLNITDRVSTGGEKGLLGLAFHPDYETNGFFYVNYTNLDSTVISRFQVTSNPDSADKNSEMKLLVFDQPYSNHNGGWIGFGPNDGYLYIATGDGGSGGDPQNNGQSVYTMLGKILRIDVDGGSPYIIPPTNPFYDSTNISVQKEIFAWGLRNPWRCSFDPITNKLWAGDVGQGSWEEVDIIENGKNYGWRCYEGNHPYNTSGCNYPEYIYPVWEYSHSTGFSITGGYVYRGLSVPELLGKYIYGDYGTRKIWSLEYDGVNPPNNELLLTAPGSITSFGVDEHSELYIVSSNGNIYKLNPGTACLDVNLSTGWNLVSVPFLNNNMSASNIFSNSSSEVFGYDSGYFIVDTLVNGKGYWVKYNNSQSMQICGTRISFPIEVYAGWNIIGPFDKQIAVENINSNPPNIIISQIFGYNSGYNIADTLKQGKGYWVKANASGTIQLNTELDKE